MRCVAIRAASVCLWWTSHWENVGEPRTAVAHGPPAKMVSKTGRLVVRSGSERSWEFCCAKQARLVLQLTANTILAVTFFLCAADVRIESVTHQKKLSPKESATSGISPSAPTSVCSPVGPESLKMLYRKSCRSCGTTSSCEPLKVTFSWVALPWIGKPTDHR